MATTNPHLIEGRKHVQHGEYAKAIKEFDLLLTSDQTNADGLYTIIFHRRYKDRLILSKQHSYNYS